jgi:hypothetical protein
MKARLEERIVIRIFHHYVSRMAFMLLLLELSILAGGGGRQRASGPALAFALVMVLSMGTWACTSTTSRAKISKAHCCASCRRLCWVLLMQLLAGLAPMLRLGGVVFLLGGGACWWRAWWCSRQRNRACWNSA